MIVRDEEEVLERALLSAVPVADEIIVVDTGSKDASKKVAEKYATKVLDFDWCDDFSAARNVSLDYATSDWAMWLDADDVIPAESVPQIKALKDGPLSNGYYFKAQNIAPCSDKVASKPFHQFRMWPNIPAMRFEGLLHEIVQQKCKPLGIQQQQTDILIEHHGYQSPVKVEAKIVRNRKILDHLLALNSTAERLNRAAMIIGAGSIPATGLRINA